MRNQHSPPGFDSQNKDDAINLIHLVFAARIRSPLGRAWFEGVAGVSRGCRGRVADQLGMLSILVACCREAYCCIALGGVAR